jgi:hypothetical protein
VIICFLVNNRVSVVSATTTHSNTNGGVKDVEMKFVYPAATGDACNEWRSPAILMNQVVHSFSFLNCT